MKWLRSKIDWILKDINSVFKKINSQVNVIINLNTIKISLIFGNVFKIDTSVHLWLKFVVDYEFLQLELEYDNFLMLKNKIGIFIFWMNTWTPPYISVVFFTFLFPDVW